MVRPGFGIFDELTASGGDRDLRDARRPASGHRAGRGTDGRDERDRGARPARRPVPAADRPGATDRTGRRRCGTRWPGPTTCWTTTSAQHCGARRCSPAGSTCRPCARSPGRATTSRCCGCSTRWSASLGRRPPRGRRTRYSLYETIRAFAESRLPPDRRRRARATAMPRHFAERGRPRGGSGGTVPPGASRSTGCRASWRTCGRRSEWSVDRGQVDGGDRHRRPRGADGLLGRAVRDGRMGGGAARRRRPRPTYGGSPGCTPPRATPASSDARRPRPPHAHQATELETKPGYESCEPGYATFIEALGAGLLRQPRLATSS